MIIVVEPQCWGSEHSDVNTALLAVIQKAFPVDGILFLAEPEHLSLVRELGEERGQKLIKYQSIAIPPRGLGDARRLVFEWNLAKSTYSIADELKAKRLIFASITSAGLWCVKVLSWKNSSLSVNVIPHIILESILNRPSLKPWTFPFWFRFHLVFGNMSQLRYLLFGESNANELCRIVPKMAKYVRAIDIPYFFSSHTTPIVGTNRILRFGSLGVARFRKGTDLFFRLATEVHRKTTKENSEFVVIGTIEGQPLRKLASVNVIVPSPDKPLKRHQYEAYVRTIDYAVFCLLPKAYRLTVCSTLYDAFSFVKPVIALKTAFFEYYFRKLGDIGYLCENYEEMVDLIVSLVKARPTKRYVDQCNNILTGRQSLAIEGLSAKLRNILS